MWLRLVIILGVVLWAAIVPSLLLGLGEHNRTHLRHTVKIDVITDGIFINEPAPVEAPRWDEPQLQDVPAEPAAAAIAATPALP